MLGVIQNYGLLCAKIVCSMALYQEQRILHNKTLQISWFLVSFSIFCYLYIAFAICTIVYVFMYIKCKRLQFEWWTSANWIILKKHFDVEAYLKDILRLAYKFHKWCICTHSNNTHTHISWRTNQLAEKAHTKWGWWRQ